MNIWNVDFDVEKYMWCVFKETEDMDLLNFSELFFNESTLHETLPKDVVFHKRDKENYNPLADIMMSSGTDSGIVSEKAKKCLNPNIKSYSAFFP